MMLAGLVMAVVGFLSVRRRPGGTFGGRDEVSGHGSFCMFRST